MKQREKFLVKARVVAGKRRETLLVEGGEAAGARERG